MGLRLAYIGGRKWKTEWRGRGLRTLKWAPVIWLLCENVKSGKWKMANMSPSIVKNYAQRKAASESAVNGSSMCVVGDTRREVKHFTFDCGLGWQLWSVKWRSYGTLVAKSN